MTVKQTLKQPVAGYDLHEEELRRTREIIKSLFEMFWILNGHGDYNLVNEKIVCHTLLCTRLNITQNVNAKSDNVLGIFLFDNVSRFNLSVLPDFLFIVGK